MELGVGRCRRNEGSLDGVLAVNHFSNHFANADVQHDPQHLLLVPVEHVSHLGESDEPDPYATG